MPGAVFVDLDAGSRPRPAPGGPAPAARSGRLRRRHGPLGIADDSTVVAYDDAGGTVAARLVWMLRVTGTRALLDGGFQAYDGRQSNTAQPSRPPRRPGSRRVLADGRLASIGRDDPLTSSWTPATGPGTAVTPSRSNPRPGPSPAPGACPAARTSPRTARSCRAGVRERLAGCRRGRRTQRRLLLRLRRDRLPRSPHPGARGFRRAGCTGSWSQYSHTSRSRPW